jgi:hypothetical protein
MININNVLTIRLNLTFDDDNSEKFRLTEIRNTNSLVPDFVYFKQLECFV